MGQKTYFLSFRTAVRGGESEMQGGESEIRGAKNEVQGGESGAKMGRGNCFWHDRNGVQKKVRLFLKKA